METLVVREKLDIEDTALDWKDAVESGKADKVLKLYLPDAIMWSTFSPKLRNGRTEIRTDFEDLLKLEKLQVVFLESNIRFVENIAINTGIYRFDFYENDKRASRVARFTFVYKQHFGEWLILNHHSSILP